MGKDDDVYVEEEGTDDNVLYVIEYLVKGKWEIYSICRSKKDAFKEVEPNETTRIVPYIPDPDYLMRGD